MYDGWDVLRVSALILISAVPLALSAWALLDAAHRPGWAWALAGRRQVLWIVLILIATWTIVGGMVVATWYLLIVRPRVAAAERGDIRA
jgi:hypothetical protein